MKALLYCVNPTVTLAKAVRLKIESKLPKEEIKGLYEDLSISFLVSPSLRLWVSKRGFPSGQFGPVRCGVI